ncbi:hypothetical protein QFZ82_000435 [Streptomyces sp. V4I23]|uniref:type VII secretion system-associated protein n=1 Tax=Streptomyces sp. V4I23 TaxID=3042282 RepID=UPI002784A3EF|nr:type VII secretion system-associated protein [Streptomyces sp. V4I23]MDQ1005806.1 hypothetical protein [Streptomyces sp. V4I23]MDQ1005950.1 hypothetical protein [Streptomyces sp. V4I23]
MSDQGNTTVLDSEWMKAFIRDNIQDFRAVLGKILKDDPSGRAISFIADGDVTPSTLLSSKPLAIGLMAGNGDKDNGVGGGELNKAIQEMAAAISKILTDHDVMFEDVEDALWETIRKMRDSQAKSLDKISTEFFLDAFEDVENSLGSDSGTRTSSNSTSTE